MQKLLFLIIFIGLIGDGCKSSSDKEEGDMYNRIDEHGLKQGTWRYYFPSGELKAEVNFKDGYRSGQEVQYYTDGAVNIKQHWIGDSLGEMLDGRYIHYYRNGQVLHEMYYNEGTPDSTFVFYYENGQMERTGKYREGVKAGLWSYYDSQGNLILTVDYRGHGQYWTEDEKAGIYTWYRGDNAYYEATYAADMIMEDTVLLPTIFEVRKDSLPIP